MLNRCESLKLDMAESIYQNKRSAPLGKIPYVNLPKHVDPYTSIFGKKLDMSETAKYCINPDKPRNVVELEATAKHDWYVLSHGDYEPGERKNRQFSSPFDVNTRFGLQTGAFDDGNMVKEATKWLPQTLLEKRNQNESKQFDDFKERHTSQVGKCLDP